MTITHFIIAFLLSLSTVSNAEIITLPSDQEVNIEVYGNDSAKHKMLWLHSERGISGELQHTLLSITKKQNIQIFLPDWLDSYYLSSSRSSLEKIPQQDFEDLISHYTKLADMQSNKLVIVASSRAAGMLLNAAHHLQSQGNNSIAGLVLISPYLQKQTPDIGKTLDYQTITSHSNLPLYVIQAERSPRFVPLPLLVKELEKGGSPVYTHVYKGITGGFHARNKDDLTNKDLKAKEAFPQQIYNAISLLKQTEAAPLKALEKYQKNIRKRKLMHLQKVAYDAPELKLKDLQGKTYDLKNYKNKVVLVSFWASWCRPCIEEMPSLVRLKEKYKDKLEILAVNVREDKETIVKFTHAMNINFPLLQDLDSSTTEDWKVFVYPSNFIVNYNGKLSYAATGAMDWQDKKLEKNLELLWGKTN